MSNEIQNTPILATPQLVQDTPNFSVYKQHDGTFKRVMKYQESCTFVPQTDEEKKYLFAVQNDQDSEHVVPMKKAVGLDLEIVEFFTSPYEKFDEKTGETENGVTTSIKSTDGLWYATSSKAVYYSLQKIIASFGFPHEPNYTPIAFTITSTKREKGEQIDLKIR